MAQRVGTFFQVVELARSIAWAGTLLFTVTDKPDETDIVDALEPPIPLWSVPLTMESQIRARILTNAVNDFLSGNANGITNGLWKVKHRDDACPQSAFEGTVIHGSAWRINQAARGDFISPGFQILAFLQPVTHSIYVEIGKTSSADTELGSFLRHQCGIATSVAYGWIWPRTMTEADNFKISHKILPLVGQSLLSEYS